MSTRHSTVSIIDLGDRSMHVCHKAKRSLHPHVLHTMPYALVFLHSQASGTRVCVCACVYACVCMCVRVCFWHGRNLGINHEHSFQSGVCVCVCVIDHTGLFMPVGELKSARRAATEALTSLRRTHTRDTDMIYEPVLPTLLSSIHDTPPTIHTHTPHTTHTWPTTTGVSDVQGANEGAEGLHGSGAESERHAASRKQRAGVVAAGQQSVLRVLCRSAAQVTAALSVPWVTDVVLDFLEVQV